MERVILHCDMNAFYASVAQKTYPHLKNKPIAVAGSTENRSGIILACSQEAKRYGVKTAEAIWQAKLKCPKLITILPEYEKYLTYSKKARAIYYQYTNQVEPFGLDECWLDCTGSLKLFGAPLEIANKIRLQIKKELALTISVGVSYNKVFAKLASDLKKPDAVTLLEEADLKTKIWPLPLASIIGAGKATCESLRRHGIITIGDLAQRKEGQIKRLLGKRGLKLYYVSLGIDDSIVRDYDEKPLPKSISSGLTLREDLTELDEIKATLLSLSLKVSKSLIEKGLKAKGVQLSLKEASFRRFQYQEKLDMSIQSASVIYKNLLALFNKRHPFHAPIRAISIGLIYLEPDDNYFTPSLFEDDKTLKLEHLHHTIHELNQRYGDNTLTYLRTHMANKLPDLPFDFNPFLS